MLCRLFKDATSTRVVIVELYDDMFKYARWAGQDEAVAYFIQEYKG
jgi:hypothetical protein